MKILAVFDEDNYQNTNEVYEKYSVRGVILRDGRLAMQKSRDGEYKLPGGGPETGEGYIAALVREIHEETGLLVIEDTVREIGEIIEKRRDLYESEKKYICHSLFYFCEVGESRDELQLTPSEIAKGYRLEWETPAEIVKRNKPFVKYPWIARDTAFIEMLASGRIDLKD